MKNDCGHSIASENSVLRCDDCEAERRKREDDALWDAAIEAAESALAQRSLTTHNEDRRRAFEDAAETVAALKREAKP